MAGGCIRNGAGRCRWGACREDPGRGIMGRPYTSGIWTVKPGREEDFVARWRELAEWASVEFPGAGRPTLLRDMDQSHRFVSFGAWQNLEQIEAFRRHAEFARPVAHSVVESPARDQDESSTLEDGLSIFVASIASARIVAGVRLFGWSGPRRARCRQACWY